MSATAPHARVGVPRDAEDDYTRAAATQRREFLEERTGASLEHVSSYSFDPGVLPGNVEHFTGVAQVPIGVAGPLLVRGEHAQGEFYVPLATAEGTLVASYNRGMKLLHEAGGVTVTVVDDRMQRAPAFIFPSAREAHGFCRWLDEHFEDIRAAAEATTRSGRLIDIERYSAGRMLYTRFNYTTGTRPARTSPARPPRRRATGSWPTARRSSATSSSRTSPRTRRARRSTCCTRAASG